LKKLLGALMLAVASIATVLGVATPANATTTFEYVPLNGDSFLGKGICLLDKTGSNQWRIGDVGNSAESGTSTVVTGYRTTSCSDYGASQTITFYLYSAVDGQCGKVTGSKYPRSGAQHSTHYWLEVTVWINTAYYANCRDTETKRMNEVGQLMGNVMGLELYYDAANNDALMNYAFRTAPGFWAKDRNGLYVKYTII
jgi:hypothetical protein